MDKRTCKNCFNEIYSTGATTKAGRKIWHHSGLHTPMTPNMDICPKAEPRKRTYCNECRKEIGLRPADHVRIQDGRSWRLLCNACDEKQAFEQYETAKLEDDRYTVDLLRAHYGFN